MKRIFTQVAVLFSFTGVQAMAAQVGDAATPLSTMINIGCALLGVCIGAAGNHWLSLSRDRRKEFNELADPIRVALKNEKRSVNINYSHLDSDAISTLADMMGGRASAGLDAAVERYREARVQWVVRDQLGQQSFSQTIHVEQAIDEILKYLKRR